MLMQLLEMLLTLKVCIRANWSVRPTLISGFCSMKQLGVFLLPLDEMPVHRRVTPSIKFAGTHLFNTTQCSPGNPGLRLSRKTSAAMLLRNYKKIRWSNLTLLQCQTQIISLLAVMSSQTIVKLCRWIVERKFWYLAELLTAKNPETASATEAGQRKCFQVLVFIRGRFKSYICFSSPQTSIMILSSLSVVCLLLVAPACTLRRRYWASNRKEKITALDDERETVSRDWISLPKIKHEFLMLFCLLTWKLLTLEGIVVHFSLLDALHAWTFAAKIPGQHPRKIAACDLAFYWAKPCLMRRWTVDIPDFAAIYRGLLLSE